MVLSTLQAGKTGFIRDGSSLNPHPAPSGLKSWGFCLIFRAFRPLPGRRNARISVEIVVGLVRRVQGDAMGANPAPRVTNLMGDIAHPHPQRASPSIPTLLQPLIAPLPSRNTLKIRIF